MRATLRSAGGLWAAALLLLSHPLSAAPLPGMNSAAYGVPWSVQDGDGNTHNSGLYKGRSSGSVSLSGVPGYNSITAGSYSVFSGYLERFPTKTATSTATRTPSPTATRTATPTATRTATPTVTRTATPSASPTATPTATPSATPSVTLTSSPTATPTATPSASPTGTRSSTATYSPTASPTATRTATASGTPTITPSATPTRTPFPVIALQKYADRAVVNAGDTMTYTLVGSNSGSGPASGITVWDTLDADTTYLASTPSALTLGSLVYWSPGSLAAGQVATILLSVVHTGGFDGAVLNQFSFNAAETGRLDSNVVAIGFGTAFTATSTGTPTVTPTITATATPSSTPTHSPTVTLTATPTATPSATATSSPTATPSATPTATPTDSPTVTLTATPTATPTSSPTASPTATPSASATVTGTATPTASPTSSVTSSATPTATGTATPSATRSATRTVTTTATPSASPSATPSVTLTATPSVTDSATPTDSPTPTPTRSATPSATDTHTPTITATATRSATRTVTLTDTPTVTETRTPTVTITQSSTATPTASPTATPTAQVPVLAVSKSAGQSTAIVGDLVNYTLVISNSGAGTAYGVNAYDTLPTGVAFAGPGALQQSNYASNDAWRQTDGFAFARGPFDIPSGQSVTVALQVLVNGFSVAVGSNITNTALVGDSYFGVTAGSGNAVFTLNAGVATATLTASPSNTYTITPTFSVSPTPTRTETPTSTVSPTRTPTATPSSTRTTTPTASPTATATRTPYAVLAISKSGVPSFVSSGGDQVTFILQVQNNGSLAAANVSVWDTLPFNVSFVSGSGATFAGGVVSFSTASIPVLASQSFTFIAAYTSGGTEITNVGSAAEAGQAQVDSPACVIGIGSAPTATATPTISPTDSPTPTSTATPTASPTRTPTASPTYTETALNTPTASPTATRTPSAPQLFLSVQLVGGDPWLSSCSAPLQYLFTVSSTAGAQYPTVTDLRIDYATFDASLGAQDVDVEGFLPNNNIYNWADTSSLNLHWRWKGPLGDSGLEFGVPNIAPGQTRTGTLFVRPNTSALGQTIQAYASLRSASWPQAVVTTLDTNIQLVAPPCSIATFTPTPVASQGKIVAYPQPAKDKLCFKFNAPANGALEIIIYNTAFQVVGRITDSVLGGTEQFTCVDISAMAPGVYYYKAKVGDFSFDMQNFGVAR